MNEPPGFSIGGAGTPTYGFAKMSKKNKQKQPKKSTKCWRAHPGANGLTCSKKHKLRKKIIKLEEMEPIIPGHRTYASNKCFIAKGSDNRGDNQSLQKSFVT